MGERSEGRMREERKGGARAVFQWNVKQKEE